LIKDDNVNYKPIANCFRMDSTKAEARKNIQK